MNRRLFATIALSAATSAALTGVVVHTVRALDIPATNPLYYRGTLEEGPTRFTGTRAFRIRLLQEDGGTEACRTEALGVRVTNGAFEVPLNSTCVNAVRNHRDLLVAVEVGETMASLEQVGDPVQLAAVPYAIEAERAVRASQADPDGGLATQLQQLQARIDALQTQVAAPDCPSAYTRDMTVPPPTVVCVRMFALGPMMWRDQVVKFGGGATVFWIDRIESAVHDSSSGAPLADISTRLPPNGQRAPGSTQAPIVALSHSGQMASNMTWFQASDACRSSSKRLPTGEEWLYAASGTQGSGCNVSSVGPRPASGTESCRSVWGAHDMVGNVWEWTAEWYAGAGTSDAGLVNSGAQTWPADYGDDGTWNINGAVHRLSSSVVAALPAAAHRGGHWASRELAGVFALSLDTAPSRNEPTLGFRCVIPR